MNFKELEEKKNDLITRAEETLNKAKEEKRELTEDEAAELAEIRDNVRKIIDTLKLDDDFQKLGDQMEKKPDDTPTEPQKGEERVPIRRSSDKRQCRPQIRHRHILQAPQPGERQAPRVEKHHHKVLAI